ncbi:MAG: hypothetical protein QW266_05585 [Sulfolobales archaeon]
MILTRGKRRLMPEDPQRLVVEIVYCSARFEDLVSRLYELLAEKAEDESLLAPLIWLSARSKSNAEFLDRAAALLGFRALEEDCRTVVGLPWRVVEEVMSEVDRAGRLSEGSTASLLKKLGAEDSVISIETYHKILFNLLGQVLPYYVKSENVKMVSEILQKMSKEEESHEEILTKSLLALSHKLSSSIQR